MNKYTDKLNKASCASSDAASRAAYYAVSRTSSDAVYAASDAAYWAVCAAYCAAHIGPDAASKAAQNERQELDYQIDLVLGKL